MILAPAALRLGNHVSQQHIYAASYFCNGFGRYLLSFGWCHRGPRRLLLAHAPYPTRMCAKARVRKTRLMAAASAAEEDRRLVLDQLAATVGEDRRQADQARAVLLVDAGGEPPDPAVVREHGAPIAALSMHTG